MKLNSKQYLMQLVPAFLWCILIFYMSHQVADTSSEMSSNVGMIVASFIIPGFKELDLSEKLAYVDSIQLYIRKLAHLSEYAMLGLLVSRAIYNLGIWKEKYKWYMSAVFCSVLYAISDEVHQLFIPGRAGQFIDVVIDSIGIVVGVLVYALFVVIVGKYRK